MRGGSAVAQTIPSHTYSAISYSHSAAPITLRDIRWQRLSPLPLFGMPVKDTGLERFITAADPGDLQGADVMAALRDLHDILGGAGSGWETS